MPWARAGAGVKFLQKKKKKKSCLISVARLVCDCCIVGMVLLPDPATCQRKFSFVIPLWL
jgi:hypothetical protein